MDSEGETPSEVYEESNELAISGSDGSMDGLVRAVELMAVDNNVGTTLRAK